MVYLKQWEEALLYIEENLHGKIDYKEVTRKAGGYEHAALPECEFYYKSGEDKKYAEIWIPINKLA